LEILDKMKAEAASAGEEQPIPKTEQEELEESIIKSPKPEGKYVHRFVYRNILTGRYREGEREREREGERRREKGKEREREREKMFIIVFLFFFFFLEIIIDYMKVGLMLVDLEKLNSFYMEVK